MPKYYDYYSAASEVPTIGGSFNDTFGSSMQGAMEEKRKGRDFELQLRKAGAVPEDELSKVGLDVNAPDIKPYVQRLSILGKVWYVAPTPAELIDLKTKQRTATPQEDPTVKREQEFQYAVKLAKEKAKLAPKGYQWTESGDLEAVHGSAPYLKEKERQDKENALKSGQIHQADIVLNKIDQAKSKVSPFTAGLGSYFSGIPATKARALKSDLDTIKANLGFSQLQEMRRSSPTGGALGAVSDRETTLLQSTVASLDQAQDDQQLRDRLDEVAKHYNNLKLIMQGINPDESNGSGNTAPLAFSSEQEAAAAHLKPGTKITINGRSAVWE